MFKKYPKFKSKVILLHYKKIENKIDNWIHIKTISKKPKIIYKGRKHYSFHVVKERAESWCNKNNYEIIDFELGLKLD